MDPFVGIGGDPAGMGAASKASGTELQTAGLAYAPPFSPAWDAILAAAKALGEQLGGED